MADGRRTGLSTQGFPLRKIVSRDNGVHVLSCGHTRPKPDPDSKYDLCKSRRCPECKGVKVGDPQLATAQSDLARKVLDVVADVVGNADTQAKYDTLAALHKLFAEEGVNVQ